MIRKSLGQILKSLQPINRADSVYEVASADRINALQDAITLLARGDHISGGVNIRKTSSEGYVLISGQAGGGLRGGGGITGFPWEITIETGPVIHVAPGTINNLLPVNIFNYFSISEFGTFFVILDVFTDGTNITLAQIDIEEEPPTPTPYTLNVAPGEFEVLLGIVIDQEPFQLVDSILSANPKSGLQTLAIDPEPGRPYYDINWTWEVLGI